MVAIAAYAVARTSSRLGHTRSRTVYNLEHATEYVADRLPEVLTAKLSHDDVKALLLWRLEHLRLQGSATFGRVDTAAEQAAARDEEVVLHEDTAVDYVLAAAAASEREIDELDVVVVLDLETEYLRSIGAVGPPAEDT